MTRSSVEYCLHRLPVLAMAILVALGAIPELVVAGEGEKKPAIDFSRQVRPLLSDNCFHCHGPDVKTRKAKLRLDTKEGLLGKARDGKAIVLPGKSAESELIARLHTDDPSELMPPAKSGKKLNAEQQRILKEWVDQGAPWSDHWAFVPPRRPAVPKTSNDAWVRTPIDAFVLARLEREKLKPSPEADKTTLIRRLSLDLTGLPPTPREVDEFLADTAPNAYEKVVDRLLASTHYGERMAMQWLDYARFADSNGFQTDTSRGMWPWRDWVIAAYNRNMPFDQFTIEQLAGDLLPNPTVSQVVATGFHRNHRLNGEGGLIAAEWRIENIVDRVDTTGLTWLGLTLGCARCHDHRFDPVTQSEYYQLFAFFNNVPESGTLKANRAGGNTEPVVTVPTAAQEAEIARIEAEIKSAEKAKGDDKESVELAKAKKQLQEIQKSVATVMVMKEGPPRDAFVLLRGQYDKRGPKVTAALPAVFGSLPPGVPANRLGLAKWIVDPANPLTARVWVNRAWEHFYGVGLVKTSDNLGSQAEIPSHPDLLDWLATEFVRVKWDMKAMHKLIAMSATYRQSSRVAPGAAERDPENRLLARGSRFRLQAELVRDQALAAGGLLTPKVGGPSVRPYMPVGVWDETSVYGDMRNYKHDRGENLYRRTMYTVWKRTAAPPTMLLFDAPSREVCAVRRSRTNTPLQALALLNEITYVEAARKLAERMMLEGGDGPERRLTHGFRVVTGRMPVAFELKILRDGLDADLTRFRKDPAAARKLIGLGETPALQSLDTPELAAYTLVANVIFNLDECVTRE